MIGWNPRWPHLNRFPGCDEGAIPAEFEHRVWLAREAAIPKMVAEDIGLESGAMFANIIGLTPFKRKKGRA